MTIKCGKVPPGLSIIEQLMTLDYNAFTMQPLPYNKQNSETPRPASNPKSSDFAGNSHIPALHPMDIMNAIYNCCDRLLLKTLMEKLNLCRLSIPLIFPDIIVGKCTLMSWGVRGIVPIWKYNKNDRSISNLVDSHQGFIAFMRSGRLPISKSKLMNEVLSSTQLDTFFHRECELGMSTRNVSNGTVEASWYLPSEYEETGFRHMFTCLNLRGDALDFPNQTQWLCKYSDLIFMLIDVNSLKTKQYSRIDENLKEVRPVLVVCFVSDSLGTVEKCKEHMKTCIEFFRKATKQMELHQI